RIQQNAIHIRCHPHRLLNRLLTSHMNHLYQRNPRQCLSQLLIAICIQTITYLQRIRPAPPLLLNNHFRVLLAREQERPYCWRYSFSNFRNQSLLNHSRPTRHRRDKTEGRGSVRDGELCLLPAADAADFDSWLACGLHMVSLLSFVAKLSSSFVGLLSFF